MNNKYSHLKIQILETEYQYSLIKINTNLNDILIQNNETKKPVAVFISLEEKSIIAPIDFNLGTTIEKSEAGWTCFKIVGSMPFGTVQGLIANISNTLINEQIGVCVVSTFKSDWFFIRSKYLSFSIKLLEKEGWRVEKESIN